MNWTDERPRAIRRPSPRGADMAPDASHRRFTTDLFAKASRTLLRQSISDIGTGTHQADGQGRLRAVRPGCSRRHQATNAAPWSGCGTSSRGPHRPTLPRGLRRRPAAFQPSQQATGLPPPNPSPPPPPTAAKGTPGEAFNMHGARPVPAQIKGSAAINRMLRTTSWRLPWRNHAQGGTPPASLQRPGAGPQDLRP